MKIFVLFIGCILGIVLLHAAEVNLEYLNARSDGQAITVEWKPSIERDVVRYDIERSTDNRTWNLIASVDAKGSATIYRYVDNDVLGKGSESKPRPSGQVYYYRLRIIGTDNSITYTSSTVVTHNLSTVRRTWGMIKEMFR